MALFMACPFLMGSVFPDTLPDLDNLNFYHLEKLRFAQTTSDEFAAVTNTKPYQKVGDNIVIFYSAAEANDVYKKIRVGFKDKKLDWIEFNLNAQLSVEDFIKTYGKPSRCNSTYSDVLDYLDYKNYNVSTDKKHQFIRHVTFFADLTPQNKKTEYIPADLTGKIPRVDRLYSSNVLDLKPGVSLEDDLIRENPSFESKMKKVDESVDEYMLDNEKGVASSGYKSIVLRYKNGLLNWIGYFPADRPVLNVQNLLGNRIVKEEKSGATIFYSSTDMVIAVDSKKNRIKAVGKF